jgi:hypothetical protein
MTGENMSTALATAARTLSTYHNKAHMTDVKKEWRKKQVID